MNKNIIYILSLIIISALTLIGYQYYFRSQTTGNQVEQSVNDDNHKISIASSNMETAAHKTSTVNTNNTPLPKGLEEAMKAGTLEITNGTLNLQDETPMSDDDAYAQYELWKQDDKYVNFDKVDDFDSFLANDVIDPQWSSPTEQSFLEVSQNQKFANSYPDFQVHDIQCKSKLCKLTFSGISSPDGNFTSNLDIATNGEIYRAIYVGANDNNESVMTAFIARGKH